MLDDVTRRDMAVQAVVDQHVGSAYSNGGKKAIRALEKLLRDLET